MKTLTMFAAVALAMAAQACAAPVGTQAFQTEGGKTEQGLTTKKANYQGASAMWETDMSCGSAAWCTVTNGSVTLMGVQPNGRFRCEANIDQGKTLEMTLSCP